VLALDGSTWPAAPIGPHDLSRLRPSGLRRAAGRSFSSPGGVAGNRARIRACWPVITVAVAWLTSRRTALICTAATNAGIDPDLVKFKRTVRVIRRRAAGPAFSPWPVPVRP